jgi:hypothetical protein
MAAVRAAASCAVAPTAGACRHSSSTARSSLGSSACHPAGIAAIFTALLVPPRVVSGAVS